mgnify:CR=1 FL=1
MTKLHVRNRHQAVNGRAYDFEILTKANPDLKQYVQDNGYGKASIDFANDQAVKQLNKALLLAYYDLFYWDIPDQFLCPPIPGRADYIHHLADLLALSNQGNIPTSKNVMGLDIGTGANLIYPILGSFEYKWRFVGSDIEPISISCAEQLVKANPRLRQQITLRLQPNADNIFQGVIKASDRFTFTICNPPFHSSAEKADKASLRKRQNLGKDTSQKLNFGGQSNELWCEGGETEFVCKMVRESSLFATQVLWFTSLVSNKDNLKIIQSALSKSKAKQVKIIDMGQGNKLSRFIAWSFLDNHQQEDWFS